MRSLSLPRMLTETQSSGPWISIGSGYRLLTEAEWELACRGGTRTAYSFGQDTDLLPRYGWFQENSGEWSHQGAQLRPNPRGLFDIHGNLFEWCHDWYLPPLRDGTDPTGCTRPRQARTGCAGAVAGTVLPRTAARRTAAGLTRGLATRKLGLPPGHSSAEPGAGVAGTVERSRE